MHCFGFFYCDNTIIGNFFHCISNQLTYFFITCRNRCNICDMCFATDFLAHFFDSLYSCICSFSHTFSQDDRVCTCCQVFHSFMNHCLCQNSCCSSTITSYIICLGCNFFDQLGTHVFESVFQFNFFCNSNTVVCDKRSTKLFVKYNVSSFWSDCYSYCICKFVYTSFKCSSCFCTKFNFFCHDDCPPEMLNDL